MFNFIPRTDAELNALRANLDPGTYQFTVSGYANTVSKMDGSKQVELHLCIYRSDGSKVMVKNWLSANDGDLPKLKAFLCSVGRDELWSTGSFNPDLFVGLSGLVKTDINKKGYPVIKYFISRELTESADYQPVALKEDKQFVESAFSDLTPNLPF